GVAVTARVGAARVGASGNAATAAPAAAAASRVGAACVGASGNAATAAPAAAPAGSTILRATRRDRGRGGGERVDRNGNVTQAAHVTKVQVRHLRYPLLTAPVSRAEEMDQRESSITGSPPPSDSHGESRAHLPRRRQPLDATDAIEVIV